MGITTNKNAIPFDLEKKTVTSGLRIGTPAITTRGMKEEQMKVIAKMIYLTIFDYENFKELIKLEVKELCERFPIYKEDNNG